MRKTILAVDDDAVTRRFYRNIFSRGDNNFAVKSVSGGNEALGFLAEQSCDCVILDLLMPEMSGLDVLKRVRSNPALREMPVIVVTGSEKEDDGVSALKLGADDYINKPIKVEIFLAKVKKHIKSAESIKSQRDNSSTGDTGVLELGPLKMDRFSRRTYLNGSDLLLSEKEFDVLWCILGKAPEVVRWIDLQTEVWGDSSGEVLTKQSETLQVTLSHLKSKLGPAAAPMIVVQKGVGISLDPDKFRG